MAVTYNIFNGTIGLLVGLMVGFVWGIATRWAILKMLSKRNLPKSI